LRAPARIGLAPVACDGKFNVVASPNGTGNNFLFSVAAVNVNDVWAVGNSTNSAGWDRTLAEHWNGTSWSITPIAAPSQPFSPLLSWWVAQNTHHRHLWPGLAATRIGRSFTSDEIVDQINRIRTQTNDPGWILFTANVLLHDRDGLTDKLERLNDHDVSVPGRAARPVPMPR